MDSISGNFCCDNYGKGMEGLFRLLSHVQVLKTTRLIKTRHIGSMKIIIWISDQVSVLLTAF